MIMKELSIEEKAKRYDEAIEKAKDYYHLGDDKHKMAIDAKAVMEYIFPELKEPEDEKIRKDIVTYLKSVIDNKGYRDKIIESWIDWLEKQGEKPNDVYDKELSEILGRVIRRYINDPNIPYTEREKVSKEIIPYVESLEKRCEQKPAETEKGVKWNNREIPFDTWSEKDELHIRELESLVKRVWAIAEHEGDEETIHKMSDLSFFLKTLKPQPKQEWSEEDERTYRSVLYAFEHHFPLNCVQQEFVKSLRYQNTWKLSDEQMLAINTAINVLGKGTLNGKQLIELQEQLMKLRGE